MENRTKHTITEGETRGLMHKTDRTHQQTKQNYKLKHKSTKNTNRRYITDL